MSTPTVSRNQFHLEVLGCHFWELKLLIRGLDELYVLGLKLTHRAKCPSRGVFCHQQFKFFDVDAVSSRNQYGKCVKCRRLFVFECEHCLFIGMKPGGHILFPVNCSKPEVVRSNQHLPAVLRCQEIHRLGFSRRGGGRRNCSHRSTQLSEEPELIEPNIATPIVSRNQFHLEVLGCHFWELKLLIRGLDELYVLGLKLTHRAKCPSRGVFCHQQFKFFDVDAVSSRNQYGKCVKCRRLFVFECEHCLFIGMKPGGHILFPVNCSKPEVVRSNQHLPAVLRCQEIHRLGFSRRGGGRRNCSHRSTQLSEEPELIEPNI